MEGHKGPTVQAEFRNAKRVTKHPPRTTQVGTKRPPGRPRLHPTNAARQAAWRRSTKIPIYHRHKRDNWGTPPEIFAGYDDQFHFTLDVCATADNAKCPRFYTPHHDGLAQEWGTNVCWMNPPFSQVARWIQKAYESSLAGATVVCLVKAATDTRWWQGLVKPFATHDTLPGRIRFVGPHGAKHRAPFPSAVVVFRPPGSEIRVPQEGSA